MTRKKSIVEEKNSQQKAFSARASLPDKLSKLIISTSFCITNLSIEREEESLEAKQATLSEYTVKMKNFQHQIDLAVLRKGRVALDHKAVVAKIRERHQDLLEGEIRIIEARSDIEALRERNRETEELLAHERAQVKEVEVEAKAVMERAKKALRAVEAVKTSVEDQSVFADIPPDMTVEKLEAEVVAEEAKLQFLHANNPNAKRDFDKRQAELEKLKEKVEDAEGKLERVENKITRIRGVWEPALDELIEEISTAFSYNFEQIGCAGEVSVNKAEDFADWAIEIRVKFRWVIVLRFFGIPLMIPQRERITTDPRCTPSIWRRKISIDHLLPHVLAIDGQGTLPRC